MVGGIGIGMATDMGYHGDLPGLTQSPQFLSGERLVQVLSGDMLAQVLSEEMLAQVLSGEMLAQVLSGRCWLMF